jgi:hypothetical protein
MLTKLYTQKPLVVHHIFTKLDTQKPLVDHPMLTKLYNEQEEVSVYKG